MVKLLVIARVIPEDVYLRYVEQNVPITSVLEKKFRVPVRDPESWYVGRLAVEIKNCYERLYKRPLGEIKYLKDDEDDCDLDPELSVSDLLIDEGKAAKDGSDQRVTVKIVQEQGRAIRAGSVIPDLNRVEYQPPARPPVPKFSENKRPRDDHYEEAEQVKRRRLGQIEEEESENLIHSIEHDGERAPSYFELQDARFLSALHAGAFGQMQPKLESPELPPWKNPHPATRDELEILPEAPKDLHFRARRTGLPVSGPRRSRELEIAESSEINFDLSQQNTLDRQRPTHGHPNSIPQQTSRPSAPFTPPDTGSTRQASRGQAVSMLNGMKSASPADRQPSTHSVKKFRKPGTNGPGIYEHPESDIDDSQMSPGSRNSRRNIAPKSVTPRLVSVFNRRQTPYSETSRNERDSTANTSDYTNNASRNSEVEHTRLSYVTSGSTAEHRATGEQADTGVVNGRSNTSREHLGSPLQQHPSGQLGGNAINSRPSSKRGLEENESSTVAKDAPISENNEARGVDADTPRKKARRQQDSGPEGHRVRKSKSRSGSAAPMERTPNRSDQVNRSLTTRTNEDDEVAGGLNEGDTTEELDGPGEQLLQNLNQNSPERSQHLQVVMSVPSRKTKSQDKGKTKQVQSLEDAERGEIERSPRSETESDKAPLPTEKKKRTKNTTKSSDEQRKKDGKAEEDLRCLTCWRKSNKCDNAQPKCASCERNKKTCQIYKMTKPEAEKEMEQRRSIKVQGSGSKSKTKPSEKLIDKIKSKDRSGQKNQQQSERRAASINKDNVTSIANSQSDPEEEGQPSGTRPTSKGSTKTSKLSEPNQIETQQNVQGAATLNKVTSNTNVSRSSKTIDNSSKASRPKSRGSSKMDTTESASKANQLLAVERSRHERSVESQVSTKSHILPPGMTQEQYDLLVSTRSQLTDEQRRADNLRSRKSESRKELTPATVPRSVASDTQSRVSKDVVKPNESMKQVSRSNSSQLASENSNEEVTNTRPAKKVPASSQSNAKTQGRKSLPATQPSNASASLQANTPEPTKSVPQPATEPPKSKAGLQKRATPIPITAAEKASVVKNNPPFRPHKALANSSFTAVNKPVPAQHVTVPEPSLGQAKSLSGLRNILDKKKSASSTPQPNSAMDRLVAQTKRASMALNGFSFGNEDEEEEEETETESDGDDQQEKENHNIASTSIGKSAVGKVQRKPTEELETGSESSDDNGV